MYCRDSATITDALWPGRKKVRKTKHSLVFEAMFEQLAYWLRFISGRYIRRHLAVRVGYCPIGHCRQLLVSDQAE